MTQPRAPLHLSEPSRRLWRSVLADFDLREDEMEILGLALSALDRAHDAARRVETEGLTHAGLHGPRVHPCVAIERASSLTAARLFRQLGLSDADVVMRRPEVFRGA